MADSVDRVFVYALNTVKRIPRLGSARPPPAERLKLYGLYKQSMEGDVDGVMDRPRSPDPSAPSSTHGDNAIIDRDKDNVDSAAYVNGQAARRPSRSTDDLKADQQKWDAWYAQRGLSRTEAKRRYIATLIDTMRVYASQTADARELVSELEFVWDQIKSNPTTTSSDHSNSSARSHSNSNPESNTFSSQGRQQGSPHSSSQDIYPVMSEGGSRNPRGAKVNGSGKRGRDAADDEAIDDRGLRVLSPMSQPNENGDLDEYRDDEEEEDETREGVDEEADRDDTFVDAPDSHMEDDDRGSPPSTPDSGDQGAGLFSSRPGPHGQQQPQNPVSAIIEPITKFLQKQTSRARSNTTSDARWQKRIENALVKMNAEMAALREQLEMQQQQHRRGSTASVYSSIVHPFSSSRPPKRTATGIFTWVLDSVFGFATSMMKHLVLDAMLLALITLWMHYRGIPPERLEELALAWIRRVQAWTVFKKLDRLRRGQDKLPVPSLKRLAQLSPK